MAPPVPLALAAIPALPDPSASQAPLSLSASPATSLSPWLSLYYDTKIITNDILNMDNTKLFQHYESSLPPEVTSDVIDLDNLDIIGKLMLCEAVVLETRFK